MGININIQRIKYARARRISDYFSTVDVSSDPSGDEWRNEISLFIEGTGHEDCAARIAALINEQIIRRDAPQGASYTELAELTQEQEEAAAEQDRMDADRAEMAEQDTLYDEEDRAATERHFEESNAEISEQDNAAIDRAKYRDDDLPF